jgi:hypothetical protein
MSSPYSGTDPRFTVPSTISPAEHQRSKEEWEAFYREQAANIAAHYLQSKKPVRQR